MIVDIAGIPAAMSFVQTRELIHTYPARPIMTTMADLQRRPSGPDIVLVEPQKTKIESTALPRSHLMQDINTQSPDIDHDELLTADRCLIAGLSHRHFLLDSEACWTGFAHTSS